MAWRGFGRGYGRGYGMWPGRGPFSYLPPWQRPGWVRFGYSPGWVGRSTTGLPPTAEWLISSGLIPPYQT